MSPLRAPLRVRFGALSGVAKRGLPNTAPLAMETKAFMTAWAQAVVKEVGRYPETEHQAGIRAWREAAKGMDRLPPGFDPHDRRTRNRANVDIEPYGFYHRTGALKRSWHIIRAWGPTGWIVQILNDARNPRSGFPYARLVHGDEQTADFERRGWRKLSDVMRDMRPKYIDGLQDLYEKHTGAVRAILWSR